MLILTLKEYEPRTDAKHKIVIRYDCDMIRKKSGFAAAFLFVKTINHLMGFPCDVGFRPPFRDSRAS